MMPVAAPESISAELNGPSVVDMAPPNAAGSKVRTASLTLEVTSMLADTEPSECVLADPLWTDAYTPTDWKSSFGRDGM